MDDPNFWQLAPAWIGAATGVAGTVTAFFAFRRWRSELFGRQDIDTARRLMTRVVALDLDCRDARFLCDCRDIGPALNKITTSIVEFEKAVVDARVTWGGNFIKVASENLLNRVYKLRNEILATKSSNPQTNEEFMKKHSALNYVFQVESPRDEFAPEMAKSVAEFETALRPYLGRARSPSQWVEQWAEFVAICRGQETDDETTSADG